MRGEKQLREGRIWAADSETDPFNGSRIPKPFRWGAYNGIEYHLFKTTAEFIQFAREHPNCIFYAHNGGKFDWHFILDYLEPETTLRLIKGRIAQVWIDNTEFRDSWNIMPMPLKATGQKKEIDYALMEPDVREHHMTEIEDYLRQDCIALYQAIEAFILEFGLHLTQAGAAVHAWTKISGEKKPKTDATFYNTIKPYYHGGRVECFEKGIIERPLKLIDINSSYPFATTHNLPWGEIIDEEDILPTRDEEIARCFITLESASTGVFPFKNKNGSLKFPNDGERRVFHITGWEFLAARDTGYLQEYEILTIFALPLTINFKAYLDHFYGMKTQAKESGDTIRYECSKRFINSGCYGKFGANPEKYQEYKLIEAQHIESAEMIDGYRLAGDIGKLVLMERPLHKSKQHFLNVATAASTTGFARAHWWRAAVKCKGVVYGDTDCILCEDTADLPLHPTELGAWDVEGEYNYAAIAGRKLYALRKTEEWYSKERAKADKPELVKRWKVASKGVKLSHLQIIQIAQGKTIKYNPLAPTFSLGRAPTHVSRNIRMT